ncbi:MAG: hypothetical protein JWR08_130 [Enterovirga sp.]|nr:hypothetical protein [Enterovirga sp.]
MIGSGRPAGAGTARIAAVRPGRFVRFVLVGVLNTGFGYLAFLVALALCPTTISALVVSTAVAVLFNFLSQGRYVFGSLDPRRLWRFVLTYGLVFGFNAAGLHLLEGLGVRPQIGGLLLLPGAVLISYGLNNRFVFAPRALPSGR